MKRLNSSEDHLKIRIEGFDQSRILNTIHQKRIRTSNIKYISETIMTAELKEEQLALLRKSLGLKYKVTVTSRRGIKHLIGNLKNHKVALWGTCLFLALVIIQNLFIMDIEVRGNSTIDEVELRSLLESEGLKKGALIYQDYGQLEKLVEDAYPQITWLRIRHEGRYVLVDLAEGIKQYEEGLVNEIDDDKPCDIVADKSGYIYEVRPYNGYLVKKPGEYVKKGQVIISGTVPMQSYAYGTPAEHQKEFYAHASGQILAKIPRQLVYQTNRYDLKKIKTGNKSSGLRIAFFNQKLDFSQSKKGFHNAISKEIKLIDIKVPFNLEVGWKTNEEVRVKKIPRKESAVKKEALTFLEKWGEKNQGQNCQIANKSLNFIRKKSIIKVSIVFNTIEKIGKEKELVFGNTDDKSTHH